MKQILYSLAIMLFVAISALAQTNIEAFGSSRDSKSSMNAIAHESVRWYNYTFTLDSADTNSFDHLYDYSDFDSSRYRYEQIVLYLTPVGSNGAPVYWYYKPLNAAGVVVNRSTWIADELTYGWSSGSCYALEVGKDILPGSGIRIFAINTGIEDLTFTVELWAGQGVEWGNRWVQYTRADTLYGDTISFTLPIINSSGSQSFWVTTDSIKVCDQDSLVVELKPMIDWQTASDYSWITLDSMTFVTWSEGSTFGHTLLDYFMPCPFFEMRLYSGYTVGDTLGITVISGGYKK